MYECNLYTVGTVREANVKQLIEDEKMVICGAGKAPVVDCFDYNTASLILIMHAFIGIGSWRQVYLAMPFNYYSIR